MTLEQTIKQKAQELGFDLVRIVSANTIPDDAQFFEEWLQKGHAGSMDYLKKEPEKRSDPQKILPGAKSIICLGINYYQSLDDSPVRIARYARGRDYHKVIAQKLKKFCEFLNAQHKELAQSSDKKYVDTGPVFERAFSQKSGLGFIGKNTCIITREFGSWIFLAEILTTLQLRPDEQTKWKAGCGTCRRCIDICPTKAILPNRSIDATKCISYLTIENRGEIPVKLREKIGNWLFGCDLCQEICPHNVRAKPTQVEDFKKIRIGTQVHDLQKILEIQNDEEFLKIFAGTPMMRAKRTGMIRNACIVAGNLGEISLLPQLKKIASGQDKMLAEHAQWAIQKINHK